MATPKQFKLLNLNKKVRKLCTNEVGGVKMKNFFLKYAFCIEKIFFLYCSFTAASLALHFQDGL